MPAGFETTAAPKPLRGETRVIAMIDDAGFFPQAFLNASATKTEAKKDTKDAVTARIDMSADVAGAGLCPECRKPMERSHANGIPVMTCDAHRIAIPIPDEVQSG
jgi:hypothetical protein